MDRAYLDINVYSASIERLDFIFDKANDGLVLLYTNPVHDYSDYVLEELGLELDPNLVEKAKKEEAQEPKSPKKN